MPDKQVKPALYFRKTVPYEHVVIPYEQLHPDLQDEVDSIKNYVRASRVDAVFWSLVVANAAHHTIPSGLIGFGTGLVSAHYIVKAMPNANEGEHLVQGFRAMFLPYSISHVKTKKLSAVIKKISENQESPFRRHDASELLKNFHYGVIDNAGNLVLLKHPKDVGAKDLKGWQLLKKMFAWKQPFQRTRFLLNKPRIRQRQRVKMPKLKLAPARLALVPVRL